MRNIKPDCYTEEEWTALAGTYEENMQCPGWASDEDQKHWDDAPEDWKEYMDRKRVLDTPNSIFYQEINPAEDWQEFIEKKKPQTEYVDMEYSEEGIEENNKWVEVVDYKALLEKYMFHVLREDGTTHVGNIPFQEDYETEVQGAFSTKQAVELSRIETEVYRKDRGD